MAKTKSFKSDTNPAMSFISQESIDKVDGKQEGATTPTGGRGKPQRATSLIQSI